MLLRCAINELETRLQTGGILSNVLRTRACWTSLLSTSKENGHGDGMRESDLGSTNKAVARALYDSQVVMICRVCQNGLDGVHGREGG